MKHERTEDFLARYFVDVVVISYKLIALFNRNHGTHIPPMTACLGFSTKNNFIGQPLAGYRFPDAVDLDFEKIDIRSHVETTIKYIQYDEKMQNLPYFALVAKPMLHRLIALHIYLYQTQGWCFNLYDTLRFKDTIKRDQPSNPNTVSFDEFIQQNDSNETPIPVEQKKRYLPNLSSMRDLITKGDLMVPSQPTDKWSYHCRGDAVDGTLFDIKTGRPVWVLSPISFMHPLSGWGPSQLGSYEPSSIYSEADYRIFFESLAQSDMLGSIAEFYEQCTQKKFVMENVDGIIKEGVTNREKFKSAFEQFGFFPWATENWHLTLKDACYSASDLTALNLLRHEPLEGEHCPDYFGLNATDKYAAEIYPLVEGLLSTFCDVFDHKYNRLKLTAETSEGHSSRDTFGFFGLKNQSGNPRDINSERHYCGYSTT